MPVYKTGASLLCQSGFWKMERAPGLAPGKSGVAARRLDDFGIARVWKMGRPVGIAPDTAAFTEPYARSLHHGLRLENGAPAWTCTTNLRLRKAACISYTSGAFESWSAMPVPPRRWLTGGQPCYCYTNGAFENGRWTRNRTGIARFSDGCIDSLCHPAGWSLGVVTLHGLAVIGRVLCF